MKPARRRLSEYFSNAHELADAHDICCAARIAAHVLEYRIRSAEFPPPDYSAQIFGMRAWRLDSLRLFDAALADSLEKAKASAANDSFTSSQGDSSL